MVERALPKLMRDGPLPPEDVLDRLYACCQIFEAGNWSDLPVVMLLQISSEMYRRKNMFWFGRCNALADAGLESEQNPHLGMEMIKRPYEHINIDDPNGSVRNGDNDNAPQ